MELRALTVPQTARVIGIGETLAYQMANDGRLPVKRVGRRLLVPRDALERWLDTPDESLHPVANSETVRTDAQEEEQ